MLGIACSAWRERRRKDSGGGYKVKDEKQAEENCKPIFPDHVPFLCLLSAFVGSFELFFCASCARRLALLTSWVYLWDVDTVLQSRPFCPLHVSVALFVSFQAVIAVVSSILYTYIFLPEAEGTLCSSLQMTGMRPALLCPQCFGEPGFVNPLLP